MEKDTFDRYDETTIVKNTKFTYDNNVSFSINMENRMKKLIELKKLEKKRIERLLK